MHLRVDTRHGRLEAEIDLPPASTLTLAGLAAAVLPLASQVEALAARHAAGRLGRPPSAARGAAPVAANWSPSRRRKRG